MTRIQTALWLAGHGVPVLPLSGDKRPLANCPACKGNSCGERPNSLAAGPCSCPLPCHGWSAATTDRRTVAGWEWDQAGAVGWHPGGRGLTVVDLDSPEAVQWAQTALPATRTVPTTRGEHWIYEGATQSRNGVMPKVDVKSLMSYAVWRGAGTGAVVPLPAAVVALVERSKAAARVTPHRIPQARNGTCPHRSPSYLARGIAMAAGQISGTPEGMRNRTLFRVLLAVLRTHGQCGCMGPDDLDPVWQAARSTGLPQSEIDRRYSQALSTLGL
ncbi:bifunctional DNA primase/polymerase [Streptomyces virginiae]|uniref:bifunctional DNA primase/polymerase n=1 Tax=Streptomyces virginiae TaxID=1961 RepID=UPI0037AF7490